MELAGVGVGVGMDGGVGGGDTVGDGAGEWVGDGAVIVLVTQLAFATA